MTKKPRPNQTTLNLPPALRARLKAHADRTGLTQAEIIRTALNDYLTAKEEKTTMRINIYDPSDHSAPFAGRENEDETWDVIRVRDGRVVYARLSFSSAAHAIARLCEQAPTAHLLQQGAECLP